MLIPTGAWNSYPSFKRSCVKNSHWIPEAERFPKLKHSWKNQNHEYYTMGLKRNFALQTKTTNLWLQVEYWSMSSDSAWHIVEAPPVSFFQISFEYQTELHLITGVLTCHRRNFLRRRRSETFVDTTSSCATAVFANSGGKLPSLWDFPSRGINSRRK